MPAKPKDVLRRVVSDAIARGEKPVTEIPALVALASTHLADTSFTLRQGDGFKLVTGKDVDALWSQARKWAGGRQFRLGLLETGADPATAMPHVSTLSE